MNNTKLVMLGDYAMSQEGYDEALKDGAVHIVDIDEASYSAMYNVKNSVQATCTCTGVSVSLGLVRDGKYIPLSVVEDTSLNSQLDYQDLDDAFELGLTHLKIKEVRLDELRSNVDLALMYLSAGLTDGAERRAVDHCIDCLDDHKQNCLPKG